MPALTHLCQKVNISVFDDTVTFYPKPTGSRSMGLFIDPYLGLLLFAEMECTYSEIEDVLEFHPEELNVKNFVHREDLGHDRYHQDTFDRDNTHMHARFDAPVDETKLASILAVLLKYNVVTPEEAASFKKDFHLAHSHDPVAVSDSSASAGALVQYYRNPFSSMPFFAASPANTRVAADTMALSR